MNRLLLAATFGALSFGAATLAARPETQAPDPDDPPSRVARLNFVSGDVAFQPATLDSWTDATVNYPLTTGDHIYVNSGGRAEMHIDGSAIRLNSHTNFG